MILAVLSVGSHALAPPPMVSEEEIWKLIKQVENGEDLEKSDDQENNGNSRKPPDPEPPNLWGMGCLIVASAMFWVGLTGYLLWKWGILIDTTIVCLCLFLIGHIWWTFRGKNHD
jgi:hypothetical protein